MKLAENVMHRARAEGAGIPVGPDRVIDALRASSRASSAATISTGRWRACFSTAANSSIFTTRPFTFSGATRSCWNAQWRCFCRRCRGAPPPGGELAGNRVAEAFAPKPDKDAAEHERTV
jgi:hypothetical protein